MSTADVHINEERNLCLSAASEANVHVGANAALLSVSHLHATARATLTCGNRRNIEETDETIKKKLEKLMEADAHSCGGTLRSLFIDLSS